VSTDYKRAPVRTSNADSLPRNIQHGQPNATAFSSLEATPTYTTPACTTGD